MVVTGNDLLRIRPFRNGQVAGFKSRPRLHLIVSMSASLSSVLFRLDGARTVQIPRQIIPRLHRTAQESNLRKASDPSASAGTTHFLREDATWQTVPPSGVSEMALTANGQTSLTIVRPEGASGSNLCAETFFANAHTLVRLTFNLSQAPATRSPNAVIGVRDVTSSTNLPTITVNQGVAGFVDSGALSIATTAGHKILVGTVTAAAGCGTVPNANTISAVFQ